MLVQYIAFAVLGLVIIGSFVNFKKTVLIWLSAQMLFNAQVAVKYTPPAMSLTLAVDFYLLFFYFIKGRRKKRQLNSEKFFLTKPMILILVSYIASLLFGVISTTQGINSIIKYFVTNFGIVFLAWKMLKTQEDVKLFVKILAFVCFIITILAISESILRDNIWLDFIYYNSPQDETTFGRMYYDPNNIEIRYGMVRARSTFGIHIAFGIACLMYFWLMQLQYVNKFKYIKTRYLLLLSMLLAAGVFMANAKTGYVGLLIILFGLYPVRKFLNLKIIVPFIAGIILICVYFPEYLNNFFSLFNSNLAEEGGGSSVELRKIQFKAAMDMFTMHPILGNGPGSIDVLKSIGSNADILGAEGALLSILPERGLFGLLTFLYMYYAIFYKLRRRMPIKLLLTFLLALLAMELGSGLRDMGVWGTALVAALRMFQLNGYKNVATSQRNNISAVHTITYK